MKPLMPKASAVWLIDNTTLTFEQIAEFTGLHPLEVSGIADGEVAQGIKGFDPLANSQLTREEIERCEKDPKARLRARSTARAPEPKKKAPRYTPLSKRLDRPAAIAWLVRNHPELADAQISKLLGTTKQTIQAIRDRSHWNSANIQPVDPVALGLCRQIDLDAAVQLAADRKAKEDAANQSAGAAAGATLLTPDESLADADAALAEAVEDSETPSIKGFEGLEAFTLGGEDAAAADEDDKPANAPVDPDALFNLPSGGAADEDESEDAPGR